MYFWNFKIDFFLNEKKCGLAADWRNRRLKLVFVIASSLFYSTRQRQNKKKIFAKEQMIQFIVWFGSSLVFFGLTLALYLFTVSELLLSKCISNGRWIQIKITDELFHTHTQNPCIRQYKQKRFNLYICIRRAGKKKIVLKVRKRATKWQNLSVMCPAFECDALDCRVNGLGVRDGTPNLTRNKGKILLFYTDTIQNVNQLVRMDVEKVRHRIVNLTKSLKSGFVCASVRIGFG